MKNLCSLINNGYSLNYMKVIVLFKKKYLCVLEKMLKYNLILGYKILKNQIEINLKYYNNKPLFKLKLVSKSSYKQHHKFNVLKNLMNYHNANLQIYSSNIQGLMINDEMLLHKVGGLNILKLEFFHKNVILK